MMDYRAVGRSLSNWGRWGDDDEVGTLNFITADSRRDSCAGVRHGKVFDLSLELSEHGPQGNGRRFNPMLFVTETGEGQAHPGGFRFADDVILMPLQCATHWDALSHVFYDGRLYNGHAASAITQRGAAVNAIGAAAGRMAGRGVLLDIPRLHDRELLAPDHVVTPAELDDACARQRVTVRPGDILLLRTGWIRRFTRDGDLMAFKATEPGIGLAACRWLCEHQVAAVACDNWAVEVVPEQTAEAMPVHCVLIRDVGLPLGEMFYLEDLAADCAQDGVYEFLLVAAPLKVARAFGSPVTPLAIK